MIPYTDSNGRWNTAYSLEPGQTQIHQLSQRQVWVTRLDGEWQIRQRPFSQNLDQDQDRNTWHQRITGEQPDEKLAVQRFLQPHPQADVTYLPALASRPTVFRPLQPLTLLNAAECTIYVGTLVSMRVCVGAERTELMDLPLADPAMTWVGPSTMVGDLCFAAPTHARLLLDSLPKRPWRAITPVRVINRQEKPLKLDRFSLPTQLLPLYINESQQLWTPQVTVVCETGQVSAGIEIDRQLPAEAGTAVRLSHPRVHSNHNTLFRALDRVFG